MALIASLTACGASLQAPPGAALQPDRQGTPVLRDLTNVPLVFVSFEANNRLGHVNIFTLPDLKLVGEITGLLHPHGECSDSAGNVYVVEHRGVFEYSHDGTQVATYLDPYGAGSWSCAVNPRNGDLAVTQYSKGVLIYTSPSSKPILLSNPQQYNYYFAGYNEKGELWVDGSSNDGSVVSRCGASSCTTISLTHGTIYQPGAVQWDEILHTWIVFDQSCGGFNPGACSYPVSEQGVMGAATNYDDFNGKEVCFLAQGVVRMDKEQVVFGTDWGHGTCYGGRGNTVDRWSAKGGTPMNYAQLTTKDSIPYGLAISIK